MPTPNRTARLLAEFVGVFTLCAAGVGAAVNGGNDLLGNAFANGLAIAIMVTAVGHISGGHFNPAVTIAMVASRRQRVLDGVAYIVAQCLGGISGAVVVKAGFGSVWNDDAATIALNGVSMSEGMFLEAIATLLLVWVIFGVAVDRDGAFRSVAGLPIGLTIVVDALMIGPLTGGAMNPARWLGPNLVTGDFSDAAVWIVGPILGGLAGALLYMSGIRPRVEPAS